MRSSVKLAQEHGRVALRIKLSWGPKVRPEASAGQVEPLFLMAPPRPAWLRSSPLLRNLPSSDQDVRGCLHSCCAVGRVLVTPWGPWSSLSWGRVLVIVGGSREAQRPPCLLDCCRVGKTGPMQK